MATFQKLGAMLVKSVASGLPNRVQKGQIVLCRSHRDVTKVCRERWQPGLDIDSGVVPTEKSVGYEREPEIMDARRPTVRASHFRTTV